MRTGWPSGKETLNLTSIKPDLKTCCFSHFPRSSSQPFPLSQLLFFLVKRVSGPLSRRVESAARRRPAGFLRLRLVVPAARLFHFYETKIKLRLLGLVGKGKRSVTK